MSYVQVTYVTEARFPAPQIRLVRQLRALQVFVIHSFIHTSTVDLHSTMTFTSAVALPASLLAWHV